MAAKLLFPIFLCNYFNKCAHLGLHDRDMMANREVEENEHLRALEWEHGGRRKLVCTCATRVQHLIWNCTDASHAYSS